MFLGVEMYSVQLTTFARAITILIMGLILFTRWRSFTKDSDVQEIEEYEAARKKVRRMLPAINPKDVVRRAVNRLKPQKKLPGGK